MILATLLLASADPEAALLAWRKCVIQVAERVARQTDPANAVALAGGSCSKARTAYIAAYPSPESAAREVLDQQALLLTEIASVVNASRK